MEIGMISVDRWGQGSQAYFLTHLHADHTNGLTPTWKWGPIFCSRLTALLFPPKFPGFKLSLLNILDIGRWHSLSLRSPSSGSFTTVKVIAIDAHHCPGAVMYLFRGEFGCMLYTGDFRWERTSKRAEIGRTMLLDALKNERIDNLYLDNTYCNPSYAFPSREFAAKQVINIIKSHPNHDIIIGIDSLGKEDLLRYISHVLKIKIWVWPERLQTMHLLGIHDIFTTKTSLTRVRAVPRYSFSMETLEGLNAMRPTIGIMPSGLPWAMKTIKGYDNLSVSSPPKSHKSNSNAKFSVTTKSKNSSCDPKTAEKCQRYIYTVPYSDHSCFAEIKELVELLKPTSIKGIVSSSTSYVDPIYYFGHHCGIKQESTRLEEGLEREEGTERTESRKIKSPLGSYVKVGRKRKIKHMDLLGIRVSRVSILRKIKHGVKIGDTECPS